MSRVSSTAKRYTGSSYTSHYSSYTSSLSPGLSSYSERDRLSSYKSPTSSSSGYSSSSYLSSSAARSRNYSTASDPDRDRGRTVPRSDILGTSSSRRSESLSRTPVKSYTSGLSGGSAYTTYSSYSSPSAQSSYLSSSPVASSISLSRRKSVSQSDLSRDLATLGLNDPSSSSSTPTSSSFRSYRSRNTDVSDSYISRSGYSGLSRSSTQEALSRSSTQEFLSSSSSSSSRALSTTSPWEHSSNGRSESPARDTSTVRKCLSHRHCCF